MTRLTLISHAKTDVAHPGRFPVESDAVDLTSLARGPAVSIHAGRWLAGPEHRAVSTAAALSGSWPVTIAPELRDWDMGRWRGQAIADLHRDEPDALAIWMGDAAAAPHGGESLLDLLDRVGRWLGSEQRVAGKLVAVTHPAVLRAAVVRALDAGPAAFWHVDVMPLSRVRLSHDGRRWVLQELVRSIAPPP